MKLYPTSKIVLRWTILHALLAVAPSAATRAIAPPAPKIRADAAIVMDARTGRVLYARNPDRRLPPASTTKILTGLLLARSLPPQQSVPTSPHAATTPGNALHMRPGERFTARDLLHAIMLVSANDASVAAAEQVSGSEPRFVARMNAEAQRMRAPHTHFVNPNGLPAPDHYSTARDLANLARAAMTDPAFAAAARTKTYPVPRDGGRPPTQLINSNRLLWTVPGMDGIKTGYTDSAGHCFVGSATRQGRRLISVVLNSPDWQAETKALLNYGFASPSAAPAPAAAKPPAAMAKPQTTQPEEGQARPDSSPPETGQEVPAVASGASPSPGAQPAARNQQAGGTATTPNHTLSDPIHPGGSGQPDSGQNRPRSTTPISQSGGAQGGKSPAMAAPLRGTGGSKQPSSGSIAPDGHEPPGIADPGSAPENEPHTEARSAGSGKDLIHPSPDPIRSGKSGIKPLQKQPGGIQAHAKGSPAEPVVKGSWLLLGVLLLLLLLWWLKRNGVFKMRSTKLALSLWKKRRSDGVPPKINGTRAGMKAQRRSEMPPEKPVFTFVAPALVRRESRDWMDSILETPNRLLEPAVRRQAQALLDADPSASADNILPLLLANSSKLRVTAAELLAFYTPRRAEETLLSVLEEEQTPSEVRAEAVQLLAQMGGDRFERHWMQILLRDGSLPAAHALAVLPCLEEATCQSLRHLLQAPRTDVRDNDTALRLNLRDAQIACVLGAHDALPPDEANALLQALPANHRDQVIVSALRGVSTPWAIERLMDTVLKGHAYPALQALLECDPSLVSKELETRRAQLDLAARTRATILQWLILGEGEPEELQKLAEAGNDLARGALQLGRTQRWDPASTSPDALLAAAQITSLRLGYSLHAQEQIAFAFRKAATGAGPGDLLSDTPELQPLAQAYAHPEVYDAVQVAMHTEDGLTALLACLARNPTNRQYQQEIAFWCDKAPRETRLLLTSALMAADSPEAHDAVAARATDPCSIVRASALRSLHSHSTVVSTTTSTSSSEESQAEAAVVEDPADTLLDQAA